MAFLQISRQVLKMSTAQGRPPALSSTALVKVIKQHYNFKSIDTDSFKDFPAYDDRNYFFRGEYETPTGGGSGGYVLKMFNPLHTPNEVALGISELWAHINTRGFTHSSHMQNKEGRAISFCEVEESSSCYAFRILHFIPGELLDKVDKKYLTPSLLKAAGMYLGKLDIALKDGFHNAAISQRVSLDWDLRNVLHLHTHLPMIDDPSQRAMFEKALAGFETNVLTKIPSFSSGVIHGDANGMNFILKKMSDNQYGISGLIDFDDTFHSCYVIDLAILLAYTMLENVGAVGSPNPVEFVGPMLQGYLEVFPLSKEEIDCLFYLVLGRLCQSAVIGIVGFKAEPWNDYLMLTPKKAIRLLDMLLKMGKEEVDRIWAKYTN